MLAACSDFSKEFLVDGSGFLYAKNGLRPFGEVELHQYELYDKRKGELAGLLSVAGGYMTWAPSPTERDRPKNFDLPNMECIGTEVDDWLLEKQRALDKVQRLVCIIRADHVGFGVSSSGTAYKPQFKRGEIIAVVRRVDKDTGAERHATYANLKLKMK